ncbi:hypothetical protein GCM10009651_20280 [Microbacterium natoriense]
MATASATVTLRRTVRRVIGADDTGALPSETAAVAPAAGASEAAVRMRLERRVGAGAAWGFSKGKTILSGQTSSRGDACTLIASGTTKVTIG